MKYAYAYVLTTCVWLPWYNRPQPPKPMPEHESVGVVCECCLPAVEPNTACFEWQSHFGKTPEWIVEEWKEWAELEKKHKR
jgi:hypothetical protein